MSGGEGLREPVRLAGREPEALEAAREAQCIEGGGWHEAMLRRFSPAREGAGGVAGRKVSPAP